MFGGFRHAKLTYGLCQRVSEPMTLEAIHTYDMASAEYFYVLTAYNRQLLNLCTEILLNGENINYFNHVNFPPVAFF